MLGKFLDFFVLHIEVVIEVLFSSILIFTLYLLYRSFKDEGDSLDSHIGEMQNLEDILKDHAVTEPMPSIQAQPAATQPPNPSIASAPVNSAPSASTDQVASLKEKELLIQQLNEKLKILEVAASSPQTNINVKDYEQKINDLKDRLAEYEIIEDDIANLSFYKSENARLKDELTKHGVAPTTSTPPAASVAPAASILSTAATPPTQPPPVSTPEVNLAPKMNAQTPQQDSSLNNVVPFPEVNPTPKVEVDIMKEFEAAVKQKENLENAASKVLSMKKSSTLTVDEDEEVKPAPPPPQNKSTSENDIMKEFGAALGSSAPAQPGFVADSEKSEKLLEEIGKMASEPPPAKKPLSEADESKKLINEFEDFVRKSSS